MAEAPPVVLSIAGFDPSSGAGVTADIKTIAAHGCYGVACVTALTVQSTAGVRRVEAIAPELVQVTLEELANDFPIRAVHIGMLASGGIVETVGGFIERAKPPAVVVDPVLKSSSGTDLLERLALGLLIERLLPLADVITPNVDEAAALTGAGVANVEEMKVAAQRLLELGARAVVVTGGHLDPAADLLLFHGANGLEEHVFESGQLKSKSTHGTGCAFSTALACNLAHASRLPDAVRSAKAYVTAAIANAYDLGKGVGPVNHMFAVKRVSAR